MKHDLPEGAALRRAIDELEKTVSASETARAHAERRMRPAPFWPDRRRIKQWTQPDAAAAAPREGKE